PGPKWWRTGIWRRSPGNWWRDTENWCGRNVPLLLQVLLEAAYNVVCRTIQLFAVVRFRRIVDGPKDLPGFCVYPKDGPLIAGECGYQCRIGKLVDRGPEHGVGCRCLCVRVCFSSRGFIGRRFGWRENRVQLCLERFAHAVREKCISPLRVCNYLQNMAI